MGAVKVSVIVPVYNAEPYLKQCLDSVLGQSLEDIELICVDDGSTDASPDILRSYAAQDPRVKVHTQSNRFAGTARNTGLDHARGDYIAFLDADDFFCDGMLQALFDQCEQDAAQICVCGGSIYCEDTGQTERQGHYLKMRELPACRPFSRDDIPEKIFNFCICAPWNKMFRRDFLEESGIRFQGTRTANDVYFGLMTLALAERITVCDRPLVTYRKGHTGHLQSAKDANSLDFYEALLAVKGELESRGLFSQLERSFANRAIGDVDYNLGTMGTPEGYLALYRFMRDEGYESLGLARHDRSFFYKKEQFEQMEAIVEGEPEIKLYGNAKSYEEELRRLNGGLLLDVQKVGDIPVDGDVKVSVIVPVYNSEDYLVDCLESALGQTLRNIEVICVDDGSTDGSSQILNEYAARDARVRLIRRENKGLPSARNAGLKIAQGEYIAFLDSDDLFEPEALETLYRYARCCGLDELFCGASVFFETEEVKRANASYLTYYQRHCSYFGTKTGAEMFAQMAVHSDFKPSVCLQLFRRDFLMENGFGFREGIVHEDDLFTSKCLVVAQKVRLIDLPLYRRRMREGSIMTSCEPFERAYGYFICVREIFQFAKEHHLEKDKPFFKALTRWSSSKYRQAAEELDGYENKELLKTMETMDPDEYADFRLLVYDRYVANQKAKQSEGELEAALDEKQNVIDQQKRTIDQLNKQMEDVKRSTTWKVGRALTWLPRKIKRAVRARKKRNQA